MLSRALAGRSLCLALTGVVSLSQWILVLIALLLHVPNVLLYDAWCLGLCLLVTVLKAVSDDRENLQIRVVTTHVVDRAGLSLMKKGVAVSVQVPGHRTLSFRQPTVSPTTRCAPSSAAEELSLTALPHMLR